MLSFIAAHQADIIAVILLLVVGPAIGNYACSVVYRLPRGQTPFEKHPYCGHCGAMLQPIDLYPILSFLRTGGACRYCKGAIPSVYTLIEAACAAILIGYYFIFGISELFLVYSAASVFIVMMAAIGSAQRFVASFLYSITALLLLVAEALSAGSIFPAIQSFVVALVVGFVLQAAYCRVKNLPLRIEQASAVWWFALLALVVPVGFVGIYGGLLLLVALLAVIGGKHSAVHTVIPCVIVTMIGVMNLL